MQPKRGRYALGCIEGAQRLVERQFPGAEKRPTALGYHAELTQDHPLGAKPHGRSPAELALLVPPNRVSTSTGSMQSQLLG
jgi:hypothetical protein